MIKLSDGGVYLLNGTEVVEEKNAPASLNKTEAQKGTISWSILNAHNTSGDMSQLKLKFDALTSHDITFVGIVQTAKASGMTYFPIPYVLTNCHNSLCAVGGTINSDDHMFGLSAAKKIWRHLRSSASGGYPPVHARDDGRRRQNDPRL